LRALREKGNRRKSWSIRSYQEQRRFRSTGRQRESGRSGGAALREGKASGGVGPASSGLDVAVRLFTINSNWRGKMRGSPQRGLDDSLWISSKQPGHQASLSGHTSCKPHLRRQSNPTMPAGSSNANTEATADTRPHHRRCLYNNNNVTHTCTVLCWNICLPAETLFCMCSTHELKCISLPSQCLHI
jgi:hypothetical protein